VQILNNAQAADLSALGVESSGRSKSSLWFKHPVKSIAIASSQRDYQHLSLSKEAIGDSAFDKGVQVLVNRTQRALAVLNPANGVVFRYFIMNVKNLPGDLPSRLPFVKMQRFLNFLTLSGTATLPLVICAALKALLLMHGFSTASNSIVTLASTVELLAVGFLPRTGAVPYPSLYEEAAIQYMALGFAYRYKVPPP
jgi:hypothetical protein